MVRNGLKRVSGSRLPACIVQGFFALRSWEYHVVFCCIVLICGPVVFGCISKTRKLDTVQTSTYEM